MAVQMDNAPKVNSESAESPLQHLPESSSSSLSALTLAHPVPTDYQGAVQSGDEEQPLRSATSLSSTAGSLIPPSFTAPPTMPATPNTRRNASDVPRIATSERDHSYSRLPGQDQEGGAWQDVMCSVFSSDPSRPTGLWKKPGRGKNLDQSIRMCYTWSPFFC